jgi:glycine reductase
VWANEDPDVVLPLDVMREMEKQGVFGKLYDYVFTTTGTGTAVANAERFGQEIGEQLKKDGVDAAILTST